MKIGVVKESALWDSVIDVASLLVHWQVLLVLVCCAVSLQANM